MCYNHLTPDDNDNGQLNDLMRCMAKHMSKELDFDITMRFDADNQVQIDLEATLEGDSTALSLSQSTAFVS
jgi:hypothetical protein